MGMSVHEKYLAAALVTASLHPRIEYNGHEAIQVGDTSIAPDYLLAMVRFNEGRGIQQRMAFSISRGD